MLWDGKPLKDADISIFVDGTDPVEKKTGDDGHVTFTAENGGLVGALANTMEKDKSGELDKKPYKGIMHYASLTFELPSKDASVAKAVGRGAEPRTHLRPTRARPFCRRCPSLWQALAPSSPTVGFTFTAATSAKSTSTRPPIFPLTSAAFNSTAVRSGKTCPCKPICKGCRL